MRFLHTLQNDLRFQMKYGFYFLYAFFSAVYIVGLLLTPPLYRGWVASLIILTDPAMLGVFFMGGVWLLEKGEGLHRFWSVSPLRTLEYILSKALSLAVLSTLSAALIALAALRGTVRFALLLGGVFLGAAAFNLLGLIAASYARSVNQYLLLALFPAAFLSLPPVLTAFDRNHPLLELFPGTALWRLIAASLGEGEPCGGPWAVLLLWLCLFLLLTDRRIGAVLQAEGGRDA